MPEDVQAIYRTLLDQGYTAKDAAKEAQKRTGVALVTNRPIKAKRLKFTKEGVTYGQNTQLKSRRGQQNVPGLEGTTEGFSQFSQRR